MTGALISSPKSWKIGKHITNRWHYSYIIHLNVQWTMIRSAIHFKFGTTYLCTRSVYYSSKCFLTYYQPLKNISNRTLYKTHRTLTGVRGEKHFTLGNPNPTGAIQHFLSGNHGLRFGGADSHQNHLTVGWKQPTQWTSPDWPPSSPRLRLEILTMNVTNRIGSQGQPCRMATPTVNIFDFVQRI